MQLSCDTILITGGTSGIGRALAAALQARGNTVLITGRNAARLEEACESMPGVRGFVCDQSDPAAVARLHAQVSVAYPRLNVLVNNAGIGRKRNLNDATVPAEDLACEIQTNFIGPVQLVARLLPHLKAQPRAAIINVTSGLAFVPLGPKPLYSATKSAMHAYTQTLRVQLRHTPVRVFELAPPATATAFNAGQEDMDAGRQMSAEQVAQAAIAGILRGREEILPGQARVLRLMGRLAPRLVLRRALAERMTQG